MDPFHFRLWTKLKSLLPISLAALPKGSMVGVAFSTFAIAIGLDLLFFRLTPFSQSLVPKKEEPVEHVVVPPKPPLILTEFSEDPTKTVGRLITDAERQQIQHLLGKYPSTPPAILEGETPFVILHDTAGEMSRQTILERKRQYKGPYGNGIAVYILRSGEAVITRPQFFTRYRPTATAYEKGLDVLSENARNQTVRQIWQMIHPTVRSTLLNQMGKTLQTQLNISGSTLAQRASYWLNASSESAFDAWVARKGVSIDGGKTTALWTIEQLCTTVETDEKTAVKWAISPASAPTLQAACQRLNPLLTANRDRVSSSVNIELLQKQGSECFVTDGDVRNYNNLVKADYLKIPANRVVPLENANRPAYTDAQYQSLTRLYLEATLQAGRFPAIVTHYWLDQGKEKKIGDHCDPRGLDLMRIYNAIRQVLNHSPETIYGIKPQYGIHPEQGDNVWWSERVLGTIPPEGEEKTSWMR